MNDVMVDIETAGKAPGGKIIAVGAVSFDAWGDAPGDYGDEIELLIDPRQAIGSTDIDTMMWWAGQSKVVWDSMFGGSLTSHAAMEQFIRWYTRQEAKRVWANGTTFDIVMLDHTIRALGLLPPWRYNAVRDMRFLRDIGMEFPPKSNDAHSALVDAKYQAEGVRAAIIHLGLRK